MLRVLSVKTRVIVGFIDSSESFKTMHMASDKDQRRDCVTQLSQSP